MKLAKTESKVIRRTSTGGEGGDGQRAVALKLSVPEAKVVASSLSEEEGEGERERRREGRLDSCSSEGSLHINDETTPSSNERQSSEYDANEATPSPIARGRARRRRRDRAEDQDYKDGDYVYPTLDEMEEEEAAGSGSGTRGAGSGRKRHGSGDHDDMWRPHGPVHLIKGSIAGSFRESRHAKKRSFEHSMSATAAKILKTEQGMDSETKPSSLPASSSSPNTVPRTRQADPIVGGGALKVELPGDNGRVSGEGEDKGQRSRAAAAANAVDAMLKAAKPKSKLLTPKQRLGKLLGLNKRKI